jgi:Tfp pilus assembly protein PilF
VLIILAACAQGSAQDPAGQGARAHLERGARHLERHEADPAIRELKSAVALDPQSARAHMLLGQAYLAMGAPELIAEAKAELQQALALEPQLLWARFYLAKIHFDLGRYEKAKIELDLAMQQRPNTPHVLSLLGEVERRLGNPEPAAELEKKALAADPAMTPAHYYLALAYWI